MLASSDEEGSTSSSCSSSALSTRSNTSPSDPAALAEYNRIVASQFDNLPTFVHEPEDEGRPMTKAEKQNAKKKRRKANEKAMKDTSLPAGSTAYRLFSTGSIKPMSLLPAEEEYAFPKNPLFDRLPPDMIERIRRIAAESVYDTQTLGNYPDFKDKGKISERVLSGQSLSSLPPVMTITTVAEPLLATARSIPTITANEINARRTTKRRDRRKPRPYDNRRPRPGYYTPPPHLGGKSQGYGWGYTSSSGTISI